MTTSWIREIVPYFRRFWHVLYTGDMEHDWDKLGADYFVADWERRLWKLSAGKKEVKV